MDRLKYGVRRCVAPNTEYTGEARLQMSLNLQQWEDSPIKVKLFNGPRVTALSPTYGVTKNPKGLKIDISGDNFECPSNDCSMIKVRFQNERGD